MKTPTYRVGQAAKALGTSTHRLRALCEAGMVEAELTDTNQWRIPVDELTRLKRDGLPPVPRVVPEAVEEKTPHSPAEAPPDPDESREVRAERDGRAIAEHRLQRRKLELEERDVDDAFEERDRRRQAEQREAQQRQATAAAAAARKQWEERTIEAALWSLPDDCPPQVRLQAHEALRQALRPFGPDSSASLVLKVTRDAVEAALQPYREEKRILTAIEEAVHRLPSFAYTDELKQKARQIAAEAISAHAGPRDERTLAIVARASVSPLVAQCEHTERMSRTILSVRLWGLGCAIDKEIEEAQKAVAAALKQLPIGADDRAFDQTKSKALEPFERVARERRAAEDLGQRAVSLLRAYLSSEYEWDSYSEEAETLRELAAELPAVIQRAYRAGHVDADNLQQFVEGWIEDRLDAGDDDEA